MVLRSISSCFFGQSHKYRVCELSKHTTASLVPDEEKQAACTPRLPYLP